MRPFHRTSLFAAAILLSAPFLHSQAAIDPSGHWEGPIHAPFGEMNIQIDLAKNANGDLAGTFSNAARNLKGFPLAQVAVEDRSVRLLLNATSGGGVFEGILDGASLSGEFITAEGGYRVPFKLVRTGDARFEPPSKSAPIGAELEGSWNGAMDINGVHLRLVLTLANQPAGASSGKLVDLDQALEVPITKIVQNGSSLVFDLKSVGASYSGSLNAEGSELAGTYTEGTAAIPVIFRRGAEGKK